MSEFLTHILSNGLRVVYCPTDSPVAYSGFIVDAGTRDEAADAHGLAHLVEHTIFKGTSRRRAYHIRNRMECVGGELNAFTSKEETVVYSIYPSAYQERAMELLGDLVVNASFPEAEFDKEREVVVEEIDMYRDTPSEQIYDEFENRLFAGHALGHHILGTPEALVGISPAMARDFLERHYVPDSMVYFVLSSMPFDRIVRWAERYFGSFSRSNKRVERVAPQAIKTFDERVSCDTHQAHVVWGRRTYNLYDENRLAMLLLNNMIGGPGQNSLLNVALREQRGYVYTVESSVVNYTDTGIFSLYFGTDSRHVQKCLQRVRSVMETVRRGLTASRLDAAKRQYLGQLVVAEDNREGLALGIGKSFLRYGAVLSQAEQRSRIESVPLERVQQVAREMLDTDSWSLLVFDA